jgi:hypothetical protein
MRKPALSILVWSAANASVMACQRRVSVRAAFVRTIVLILDQHALMGQQSSE